MKRLKLVLLAFAFTSLMLGISSTQAFADERGDQRNRQRNDKVEQRGGRQQEHNARAEQRSWGQREHVDYQGKKYDYHEGRFYKPGLFGFILDLVLPPRGIVVSYLPAGYRTISGEEVKAVDIDMVSRLLFMLRMHKTYPGTGTVCTGAAARIPGSIVWEVMREEAKSRMTIRIGHPGGIIPVESEAEVKDGKVIIKRAAFYRTARRIMEGYVYVRKSVFT